MALIEINGTSANEDLVGSESDERLNGLGGSDRLYARGGNDELFGGAGNDLLDGGTGADIMYGGAGDDVYRVDDLGDFVSEESSPGVDDGGRDYVHSSVSYTLGAFIERLELQGTADLDGTGNELDNVIKGNGGANTLSGGAGVDTLKGGGGDDILIGGAGKDYLFGEAGADTFVLRPEAGTYDKIYDFASEDTIAFYSFDFGLLEGAGLINGALDPAYFVTGTAATATNHGQFIFNGPGLELLWDADGIGGDDPLLIAKFAAGAVVTASQLRAFDASVGEDSTAPVLQAFTSTTADGAYGAGATITIVASFDEAIAPGSSLTVTLDTGASVVLSSISGATLSGDYTVDPGMNTSDLTVTSITAISVSDAAGNTLNATNLPASNLGDTSAIVIDTVAPGAPSTPDLVATSDTGDSASDNITTDITPDFTGSAEPGGTVSLYADGALLGTTSVDGTGAWNFVWATDASVAPLGDGSHNVTAIATDAAGNMSPSSSALTVTVEAPPATFVFERAVVSGLDDVEERSSGSIYFNSSDLELVEDKGTAQTVGIRFTSIDVPAGAVITSAYIQFTADEVSSGTASLLIHGDDSDSAAAFTNASHDVSSRDMTSASATWSPDDWTSKGEAGGTQSTSDVSAIVQEIIDRDGWAQFNDVAFILTGTGTRTAEAFEGTGAPVLHVEYYIPDNGAAAPEIDLDANASGNDYTTTYRENGAAVMIAGLVAISDADSSTLEFASISISDASPDDLLSVNDAALPAGITVDPISTADRILLIGTASLADYEIALQQVFYESTSETPDPSNRSIQVQIGDGLAQSSLVSASVFIDRAPDAFNDFFTTQPDTPLTTGNVIFNDDQGDGPAVISVFDAISAEGGSVVYNNDGTFTFTPVSGFTGNDSFTYGIADADGDTSSATVIVSVTQVPDNVDPEVSAIHNMWALGIPDPSGLAYDSRTGILYLSDSEIDESPTNNPTNFFALGLDGALANSLSLPYTDEPTGISIDASLALLYVSDDDDDIVYVADADNPATMFWSFDTTDVGGVGGGIDPEDLSVDPTTNHLFVLHGLSRSVQEIEINHTNQTATLVDSFVFSDSRIEDPEAIVYDPVHDVFLVGGGFGPEIFVVDRNGDTLHEITLLEDYRNDQTSGGGTIRTSVKSLELAPASDGSGETHVYVADFGDSHKMDGRLIEVDLGAVFDPLLA